MVDGYNRRQKNRKNELLAQSWYTAYLYRVERMPSLKSLLQDVEEKPQKQSQTDDEMLAMAKILNAAFGGEVVET